MRALCGERPCIARHRNCNVGRDDNEKLIVVEGRCYAEVDLVRYGRWQSAICHFPGGQPRLSTVRASGSERPTVQKNAALLSPLIRRQFYDSAPYDERELLANMQACGIAGTTATGDTSPKPRIRPAASDGTDAAAST